MNIHLIRGRFMNRMVSYTTVPLSASIFHVYLIDITNLTNTTTNGIKANSCE